MKRYAKYITIYIFFCSISLLWGQGQESKIGVEVGERTFSQQKPFTLTVKVKNSEQYPDCKFPDIKGFNKRGVSRSTATATVGGKPEVTQSIVQEYVATKAGTFKFTPQTILVNNIATKTEAFTLTVTPSTEGTSDVFDDLFDEKTPENANTKADAFLSLNINKSSVYVGEGFAVTLSFYVAKSNAVEMEFYDLNTQIPEILKQLKPLNCWEENFGITEPQKTAIIIKGKPYDEYRLYQAVFFPINNQPIKFPAVGLKMLNYKVNKTGEKTKTWQTFSAQGASVQVKELPLHPQRNEASVGTFHLEESVGNVKLSTGKSFQYDLHIGGEGNITTIKLPDMQSDSLFDFYRPDVRQTIVRKNGKVSGDKLFSFHIIPKQAGFFPLNKYFKWIYFQPEKGRYDTLQSHLTLTVSGKKITDESTPTAADGSIYENIEQLDSTKEETNYKKILKDEANMVLIIMLVGMIYIFWRRGKV